MNRRASMAALNAAAEVVDTARGPVEFARRGGPPYVLILHGTPQGHHASMLGAPFEAAGFGTVTPSRPGYLRTPLASGRSFPEQADAAAALLDQLQIDRAAVYAVSGGGPSSIEFAARHPERTACLILEAAISQRYAPQVSNLTLALTMNSFVFWVQSLIVRHAPRLAVSQLIRLESTLAAAERSRITDEVLADPQKMQLLQTLAESPPFNLMRAGFENDMTQFASLERLPLEQVRCPALIVHGTHDGDVPYRHAEQAAAAIPNAALLSVQNGWHLLALSDGGNAYQQAEIDFLRQHHAASA